MELYCWQSFSFIVHINYLLDFQVFYCTLWNLNAEIQLITLNTVMTRISCIRCSHWVIYLLDVLLLDLLYRCLSTLWWGSVQKQTIKMLMMNHSTGYTVFTGYKGSVSVLITIFGYKHRMMCEIILFFRSENDWVLTRVPPSSPHPTILGSISEFLDLSLQ